MTPVKRTMRSAVLLVLIAPALAAGASVASASPPSKLTYDALGDSYASGYGVGPYESTCGRSQSVYAVRLDGRKRIDLDGFVACAGATTTSLLAGGQVGALDAGTDLVTLSIGGNDTGWSSAVVACLGGNDQQCAGATAVVRGRITGALPALLDTVYDQVAAAAPHAQVLVTGYPRLFSPESGAFLGASVAEQEELNAGADLLNGVLAGVAADHGFDFVDVTKRFGGHGANSPEPWILGPADPGAFHPNAAGYEAYTAAVTAAVTPASRR
jgi:lysophospholipase L1-like esterase